MYAGGKINYFSMFSCVHGFTKPLGKFFIMLWNKYIRCWKKLNLDRRLVVCLENSRVGCSATKRPTTQRQLCFLFMHYFSFVGLFQKTSVIDTSVQLVLNDL
jgi:hypothetical protein